MIRRFFERPYGTGAGLNIYMFSPSRLRHILGLFHSDKDYFIARSRVVLDQLLHPRDPWLTRESIEFLNHYLRKDMHGLEFGSGRSTKWFARRVKRLVSVEDDPAWYARVQKDLVGLEVDYRFAQTTSGCEEYVGHLRAFPDDSFDFVIIDGSCREACIVAAPSKIRRGGIIVLDNADKIEDVTPLAGFSKRQTGNGVWRTDIYTRLS